MARFVSTSPIGSNAWIAWAAALLAGGLLACGGGDESPPETSKPPPAPAPAPAPAPETSPPAPPPPPAEPAALLPGDAAAGQPVYVANCATCHGPNGGGDGPLSASLDPSPARHNDGAYMNGLDDAYLTKVIAEGGAVVGKSALMAPWAGTLSDQDIANVIAFIRTLADPPYSPPAGK